MLDVLIRAGCFVGIIILGFLLKKIGVFKDSDYSVLSTIVMKITLPAAIITNIANKEIDLTMFTATLLGFGFGLIYVVLGFLLNLHKTKEQRAFEILNLPGYNIGCFAMPFVQSFLGPIGVITASLFDIGNAFVCLGGSYSIATMVKDGERFSFKRIIKTLLKSIPFVLYVIMPLLCIAKVRIPDAVTTFAGIVGNANPFMAMFIIGIGFKLTANKSQIGYIFKIISADTTTCTKRKQIICIYDALRLAGVYISLVISYDNSAEIAGCIGPMVNADIPAFARWHSRFHRKIFNRSLIIADNSHIHLI